MDAMHEYVEQGNLLVIEMSLQESWTDIYFIIFSVNWWTLMHLFIKFVLIFMFGGSGLVASVLINAKSETK